MKFFTGYLILFLFNIHLLHAQQKDAAAKGEISGTILDKNRQPLAFVNILLLTKVDSILVKGTITDDKGRFTLDQLPYGNFRIIASMTGYMSSRQEISVENSPTLLSEISLEPDSKLLSEVTIIAKKPFIEQQLDRTIINVENSIVSAGGTALEVLEKAPGITVDQQNEQLILKGKQGVIVQIDGKQSFLSQQEVINMLRNTPSSNIEKIELITNPSAKYDAAGNSGIINIKMKRNKNYGTNGNINLSVAHSKYARENASVVINKRAGKISAMVSGSAFLIKGFSNNNIKRKIEFGDDVTIFHQKTDWVNKSQNYTIRTAVDFIASPNTTIGLLLSGFHNHRRNPRGQSNTNILNEDLTLRRTFQTDVRNLNTMSNASSNLNFKHLFGETGKELTFDIDYVRYDGNAGSELETNYYSPQNEKEGEAELVRNNMPSEIKIGVVKVDFTQPLWNGKFETGMKASLVSSDNDMVFETKTSTWIMDVNRSNRFKYTENVNAGYINFSKSISKRIRYQAGLRGEHTHSIGHSITIKQKQVRDYINLFPSIFISTNADTNHVFNFSYSRRIDRPNYQLLNPFELYLDPYTFIKGNPHLKPQFTHSFQLIHIFKDFLNTSFGYSRIKDMIADELPQQIASENKTFVTADNLDHQNSFSFSVSFPSELSRWWKLQTNFLGTYNRYKSYYLEEQLDIKQLSWNLNISNSFTISKSLSAELGGWYNSSGYYGIYATKPFGMVNAGIQQTIFENKGTIRLAANDIFWTNRFRGRTIYKDIDFDVRSQWPSRQFRVTFTYNFGNQNVKGARTHKTGSYDLQNRVNSGS